MPNNSEYTIIKTIKHLTINKNSIEEQIFDDSVKYLIEINVSLKQYYDKMQKIKRLVMDSKTMESRQSTKLQIIPDLA